MSEEKREKNPLAVRVGTRLRQARERLGLTQGEAAKALKITEEAYGSYERGYSLVTTEVMQDLPRVLKRPLQYFFGQPDPGNLNPEERVLVELFRGIQSPDIRDVILTMVQQHAGIDRRRAGGTGGTEDPEGEDRAEATALAS